MSLRIISNYSILQTIEWRRDHPPRSTTTPWRGKHRHSTGFRTSATIQIAVCRIKKCEPRSNINRRIYFNVRGAYFMHFLWCVASAASQYPMHACNAIQFSSLFERCHFYNSFLKIITHSSLKQQSKLQDKMQKNNVRLMAVGVAEGKVNLFSGVRLTTYLCKRESNLIFLRSRGAPWKIYIQFGSRHDWLDLEVCSWISFFLLLLPRAQSRCYGIRNSDSLLCSFRFDDF